METSNTETVQLLQASADREYGSYLRIAVNGTSIKYLVVDPGIYNTMDLCCGPLLIPQLPNLPSGDWNEAKIRKDAQTGQGYFTEMVKLDLPGIKEIWHPTVIEYLELQFEDNLRGNDIFKATHPKFSQPVVAKFARFAPEIPWVEAETRAYRWIDGHNIGPKFLGHISENGRIIGFIVEFVDNVEHAEIGDLPLCQVALGRLHQLGIKHGDNNKYNMLVHDGRVTLIDFDFAQKTDDPEDLKDEMDSLSAKLLDTSFEGGVIEYDEAEAGPGTTL